MDSGLWAAGMISIIIIVVVVAAVVVVDVVIIIYIYIFQKIYANFLRSKQIYIYIYIYIYVERTFWVYFVPSPNSIISPPRSNRYIGAILKNKSLWLRNNFSMMNKSAWWEGAGGAANFWSFSSSHSPRKHSASQANCLDSACAHTGLVLKVEAGDRRWVPLEVRVEVKKVSDQQNSKLCEWNWRHSIEQERKSTVQTGLAQVHMGDLSVPSWDACKELRWAEIFKSPPFVRCVIHLLSLCSMQPSSSSIVTGMKGLSLDQWRCIYLSTCCWWGTMGS